MTDNLVKIDNAATTRKFFEDVGKNGFDAVTRYTTPDFTWWVPGMGNIQENMSELGAIFAQNLDGSLDMIIHDIITDGDKVAVEAESRGHLKDGTLYNNRYHYKFIFDGEKIASIKEYNDTKHASEVWGKYFGA